MKPQTIAASVVAGLATGPRSFTGLAAVVLATPADATAQPDRTLAHPATKTGIGLLALSEWVLDKLPKTPSRLEVLGLITRATGAGASGAILARRAQVNEAREAVNTRGASTASAVPTDATPADSVPPDWKAIGVCTATAAGVSLGVAVIGVHLRGLFQHFLGEDWFGAGLEDASSAALAAASVYLSGNV